METSAYKDKNVSESIECLTKLIISKKGPIEKKNNEPFVLNDEKQSNKKDKNKGCC